MRNYCPFDENHEKRHKSSQFMGIFNKGLLFTYAMLGWQHVFSLGIHGQPIDAIPSERRI